MLGAGSTVSTAMAALASSAGSQLVESGMQVLAQGGQGGAGICAVLALGWKGRRPLPLVADWLTRCTHLTSCTSPPPALPRAGT